MLKDDHIGFWFVGKKLEIFENISQMHWLE
jgi:hypothetical protein